MSAADHLIALMKSLDAQEKRLRDQRQAIVGVDTLIRATEDTFPIDLAVAGTDITLTLRLGSIGGEAFPAVATFTAPVEPQVFDDPIWPRQPDPAPPPAKPALRQPEPPKSQPEPPKSQPEPPKSQPEPPKSQPATEAPKPASVTGPFSGQENAVILEMASAGKTRDEIAAALNRSPAILSLQIKRVMARAEATGRRPKKVAPPPTPAPPVQSIRQQPDPLPPPGALASAEARARRIAETTLDRLHGPDAHRWTGWTPSRDLELVRMLTNGDGLGAAAEALGIGRDDAKARWKALIPEVTLEAQAAMLGALRERCEEREAAE